MSSPRTTLSFDVGGTGVKASVLDSKGTMRAERVRVATPYPCSPEALLAAMHQVAAQLPAFDRVSVGFPGVVRDGVVLSAPEFVTVSGLGSKQDPQLVAAWNAYALGSAVANAFKAPAKIANDADMQGAAVVKGKGIELVVTLGTGVGTALFDNGRLAPHLELAHHLFRKGETYSEQLGNAARKRIGKRKWNARVHRAIETLDALVFFDALYVGGGNAKHVTGDLGTKATIVGNEEGILGGIKLWEQRQLTAIMPS